MIQILLSFGGLDALFPLLIILILVAAAASISRGYDIFSLLGIGVLAGVGRGAGSKGTFAHASAYRGKMGWMISSTFETKSAAGKIARQKVDKAGGAAGAKVHTDLETRRAVNVAKNEAARIEKKNRIELEKIKPKSTVGETLHDINVKYIITPKVKGFIGMAVAPIPIVGTWSAGRLLQGGHRDKAELKREQEKGKLDKANEQLGSLKTSLQQATPAEKPAIRADIDRTQERIDKLKESVKKWTGGTTVTGVKEQGGVTTVTEGRILEARIKLSGTGISEEERKKLSEIYNSTRKSPSEFKEQVQNWVVERQNELNRTLEETISNTKFARRLKVGESKVNQKTGQIVRKTQIGYVASEHHKISAQLLGVNPKWYQAGHPFVSDETRKKVNRVRRLFYTKKSDRAESS